MVLFYSCKKDGNNSIKTNPLEGKIKSFEFKYNGIVQNFMLGYDEQGRAVKLLMDSIILVEIEFLNDTLISAKVNNFKDEELITNIERVLINGKKIIGIEDDNISLIYPFFKPEYNNDSLLGYQIWGSMRFGLGVVFSHSVSNIFKEGNNVNYSMKYSDFPVSPPYFIEKNVLVKFEYFDSLSEQQFPPMQHFTYVGFWDYNNNDDYCSKLLYLLSLNEYYIGFPSEKLISNIYIDGSLFKLYEYEFDINNKVTKMYEKNSIEDSLYSTFTMEYY